MSEVSLFRKYESKQNLVKMAIEYIVVSYFQSKNLEYTGDLENDLVSILSTYREAVDENGDFISALLMEASRNPDMGGMFDHVMQLFKSIGEILMHYQKEGRMKNEHPLHAVISLLSPIIMTSLIRRIRPDSGVPPINLEEFIEHYLEGRTSM